MTNALTPHEEAHARSVGDTVVALAATPDAKGKAPRVLVASVIRKPPVVVAALLKTLAWQRLRKPATLEYAFITDFAPSDAFAADSLAMLKDFTAREGGVVIEKGNGGGDYSDAGLSHSWTLSAMQRVGAFKNELMQRCLDGGYEALWLIDADVLCDPYTLQSMVDCEAPIVAAVYWTRWLKPLVGHQWNPEAPLIHAAPQVWLRHPYKLDGHGLSEPEFRRLLVTRQLVRVGGLGACTLFHRAALEKGVSFTPVPEGLPAGGMSDGEDRHLCERARRLHLPLLADAWPDIYHAYFPDEYRDIEREVAHLDSQRPETPKVGDLVSFKLDMTEPVPSPQDPRKLVYVGPQYGRGRLGSLTVLPEVEEELASMRLGERRLLQVHFPAHTEYANLRGLTRIISLTLFDAKPFRLAPIIENEVLQGNNSRALLDATTMTERQLETLMTKATAL